MRYHVAYISVGSNVGNKRLNCRNGIAALTKGGTSFLKAQSGYYRTEPVDYEKQEWFVNVVVKIETTHDPHSLLNELKAIEQDAGRKETGIRFGPRVLDMDVILYDQLVIESPGLIVPHPRMHRRRFVLKPICDIDPTVVHPVLHTDMQSLLESLDDNEQRIIQLR